MKTICKTAASLFLASLGGLYTGSAQADLMYHVAFSDIEGAIMPAVPFPSVSALSAAPASAESIPNSLGLAPNAVEEEKPAAQTSMPMRKRPLSASETSDLLLR